MSTEIKIEQGNLVVELSGLDIALAVKRRLEFPLTHVSGARVESNAYAIKPRPWLRAPGTGWPGAIRAGSFRGSDGWSFWNIRRGKDAVVIELHDERYNRVVLEVPDPTSVVDTVNTSIAR